MRLFSELVSASLVYHRNLHHYHPNRLAGDPGRPALLESPQYPTILARAKEDLKRREDIMILPDDVDEKVEFWVGESDTESDNESDSETVVGQGARPRKAGNLIDSRTLRNKVRREKGSGSNNKTGGGKRRRILGNGLLAVQSESRGSSRNQHAFELKLEMRRVTRSEEGKGTPPIIGVRRNPTEKGPRWRTIGGLPDTGSEPVLSHSLESRYTLPTTSSTSLGGHERRWAMRPPGLGLDLWPDYVSPRQQVSSTLSPRGTKVPKASPREIQADLPHLPEVNAPNEQAGSDREGSIDEEPPRNRAEQSSKETESKERRSLAGAIWNWAWHWR